MQLLADILFWPGNTICRKMGIDPDGDAGLLRWLLNSLIYTIVSLIILGNIYL